MDAVALRFKAMGCPCEIRLYPGTGCDPHAGAAAAQAEVLRLERKYTRYRDDSVTSEINRTAGQARGIELDVETAGLLDYAATAWRESDGLFDPTSGVLRRVWDFRSGQLPDEDAVREQLTRVGWDKLEWRRPRLRLPLAGMQLDFGGFVKEYAADRVAHELRQRGFRSGLVDLGGDLAVVGPHPDASPWRVGIRNPHASGRALTGVALARGGIATSGDYERGMLVDGQRYGHILDPRSGWPVEGLASVSVIADQCLVAGTAATVAMLKGGRGERWLRQLGLPFAAVDRDGAQAGDLLAETQRTGGGATRAPSRARRSTASDPTRRNATSSTSSPTAKRYGA